MPCRVPSAALVLTLAAGQSGYTPLRWAVNFGNFTVIEELLRKGAHVNVKDKVRETSARTIRLRTCLGRDSQKTRKKRCWSFAAQV